MSQATHQALVVAGDAQSRKTLSKILTDAGYGVRLAANAPTTIDEVLRQCPDFVVVDDNSAETDGLALCQDIRDLNPPKYIYQVLLAKRGHATDVVRGLQSGADDYLMSPVCEAELLARLCSARRILDRQRRLSDIVRNDTLTGLYTRRTFDEILQRECSRSQRHDEPLSCVIFDVDFFKQINDQHGHPAGDAVLKGIANSLNANCRVSDVLCRYGGEEFIALLPHTDEENATLWAERQREHIAAQVFDLRSREVGITCSFGVAELDSACSSATELVDAADQALLFAKQAGRNRVASYSAMHANAVHINAHLQSSPVHNVHARDIMTVLVSKFSPEETIGQAASHFLRSRTSCAPVVEHGKLVGLLAEKDLVSVMLSPGAWLAPIRRYMKTSVACYDENTPISVIYEFLARVSIRQVVILSEDRPIGIVSRECLVRWFTSWGEAHSSQAAKIGDDSSGPAIADWVTQLSQLAAKITQRAIQLQSEVSDSPSDLVPKLVSGASQIEAALADLLSYSRFAQQESRCSPENQIEEAIAVDSDHPTAS